MSDLKKYSDKDLQAELARRAKEAEEARERAHAAHADAVAKTLTKEFVDALMPSHQRTSCSDDNRANGFYTGSDRMPRCDRCALLELLENGRLPEGVYLHLEINGER